MLEGDFPEINTVKPTSKKRAAAFIKAVLEAFNDAGGSLPLRDVSDINHPWTNGQVERMNRTIKEATVKRFHYDDHQQLRHHLADFIDAYNFGRRLKMNSPWNWSRYQLSSIMGECTENRFGS